MKIIKRNGKEEVFHIEKIKKAITGANRDVSIEKLTEEEIDILSQKIYNKCLDMNRTVNVEEVQNLVEVTLMEFGNYEIAKKYITYRYNRALVRKANSTDDQILSLIECTNEEIKQENSNKNPTINSVQRDYMAGEVSKDITKRVLLPEHIVKAHEEGIIHFHDSDYFAQHMHNCCLVNLEDMLQNGTVISETMIERPKSFSTACNIATQIIAQVASSQYGGQSISLSHLAPFVEVSRQKIAKQVRAEAVELLNSVGAQIDITTDLDSIIEKRVYEEVKRGVQIIQYQIITLMTTNGQAPFVTVFMCLDEVEDEKTKADLIMIIEEVLRQRIDGVKNEKGVCTTPAFPKLIYVLDENNATEGSKYYELTKLAAQCSAKRLVPDYISAKVMKELKGDVYPSMGKCKLQLI